LATAGLSLLLVFFEWEIKQKGLLSGLWKGGMKNTFDAHYIGNSYSGSSCDASCSIAMALL
jgi:hypothetical protein